MPFVGKKFKPPFKIVWVKPDKEDPDDEGVYTIADSKGEIYEYAYTKRDANYYLKQANEMHNSSADKKFKAGDKVIDRFGNKTTVVMQDERGVIVEGDLNTYVHPSNLRKVENASSAQLGIDPTALREQRINEGRKLYGTVKNCSY